MRIAKQGCQWHPLTLYNKVKECPIPCNICCGHIYHRITYLMGPRVICKSEPDYVLLLLSRQAVSRSYSVIIVFLCHRAGSLQQPFYTGIFLSKNMQCYLTLNGGKNYLSTTQLLLHGRFRSVKTLVSCLFQLMHIVEGTNNLYNSLTGNQIIQTV